MLIIVIISLTMWLTVLLSRTRASSCSTTTILDKGLVSSCDLTPINVFSEDEEINWFQQAYYAATGFTADYIKGEFGTGGFLLGQAVKLIESKTADDPDISFQKQINDQFEKMLNCMDEKIEQNEIQNSWTRVMNVMFYELADCDRYDPTINWEKREQCLSAAWTALEAEIDDNFGEFRQKEDVLTYAEKETLYTTIYSNFVLMVTSYLDEKYKKIINTLDSDPLRAQECNNLYAMIQDANSTMDIFEDWINDAYDSLATAYKAVDLSGDICPDPEPSEVDILYDVNRIHYYYDTVKVYDYPLEGDPEFKGWKVTKTPNGVEGTDVTHISGSYSDSVFTSRFSVNFNINSNGASCDFEISCTSAVTETEPAHWQYELTPNMASCCGQISVDRAVNIASINEEFIKWKEEKINSYVEKLTNLTEILEAYPLGDTECKDTYFYPGTVPRGSACSLDRDCENVNGQVDKLVCQSNECIVEPGSVYEGGICYQESDCAPGLMCYRIEQKTSSHCDYDI